MTENELIAMSPGWIRAGEVGAQALVAGQAACVPGARASDVAIAMEDFIRSAGLEPAFPGTVSIDSMAAHWSPTRTDDCIIEEGQLVKLDCGASHLGDLSDNAITIEVGGTNQHADLIRASEACLAAAIDAVRPGLNLGDLGAIVEATAEDHGFQTIENLGGHSLERNKLHAALYVPSIGMKTKQVLKAGDRLAIEPFVTDGRAGRVQDAGPSNVYHLRRLRPQRAPAPKRLLAHIQRTHPHLAFSSRWLEGALPPAQLSFGLNQLQRTNAVTHYTALREASGGMVAQREATVMVSDDGGFVTTKSPVAA